MDFGLSEDQLLFKTSLRRFLDAECPTTRVRAVMESAEGHDPALWRGLAEMGVAGLLIPEAHGGAGLELLDAALAAEELGRACTPGPFLAATMAAAAFAASDDDALRARWLPGLASGDLLLSVALPERLGEIDPAQPATRAQHGTLTGEKSLVPAAAVADALLVSAMDEDGPGLWIVERSSPGVEVTALKGTDMTRRVDRFRFANAPAVKLAAGPAAAARARDAGLVLLAADAYGGSMRCVDMTRDYALTREQFGRTIASFQGVKHQLADLVTDLEPACSLWWYAAHAFDHVQDRAERHAALAKAHLADLYDRAIRTAIELHGGIGFTWEFDLHLWFRRAMFDRAFLGEAAYHRARAAALAGW
jgi:alkylation response protein AidB-like acyl-CoA dehydrogenase